MNIQFETLEGIQAPASMTNFQKALLGGGLTSMAIAIALLT